MKLFLLSILLFLLLAFALIPALAYSQNKPFATGQPPGTGLWGEYYNGTNFQEKVYERYDHEIDFYHYLESPAPGVEPEYYSIRWTGSIFAPVTGTYTISVKVDDGVRLWLNGVKILDQWKLQQLASYTGKFDLEAGRHYDIKIDYYNGPVHGIMQLMWIMPEENEKEDSGFLSLFDFFVKTTPTRSPIPKKYLYGPAPQEEPRIVQAKPEQENKKPAPAPEQALKPIEKRAVSVKFPKQEQKQSIITRKEKRRSKSIGKAQQLNLEPVAEPVYDKLAEEDLYENLKPGDRIQFMDVLFEQGKYLLLDGSHIELDKLVRTLNRYPELQIRIDGHTDNVGIASINQSLSYFRAKVVATYLIEKGINPSRIEAHGNGSNIPVADNTTEAGRAKNRRVEFLVR